MAFEQPSIKHCLFADDEQAYYSAPLHGVDDERDSLHDYITDTS